jgi:hypothetical protein
MIRRVPPVAPTTGIAKWVTIIECILADGTSLPPYIIHRGKNLKSNCFYLMMNFLIGYGALHLKDGLTTSWE